MSAVSFPVCAPEKKEQTFGVLVKSHLTKSMGKERKASRESRFLRSLSSRKRPVLVFLICGYAILFSGSNLLYSFVLQSA